MTHGWPGSVIELLETVGPLTDPAAHGGTAADAFHLVLPSIPGYGFSAQSAELGWYAGRTAQAWAKLMHRLGYPRYVAQGGDQGAAVTDAMGRQAPEGLIGIHTNLLVTALGGAMLPSETEEERAAAAAARPLAGPEAVCGRGQLLPAQAPQGHWLGGGAQRGAGLPAGLLLVAELDRI
jgi:pimeloyl-ACP methyl ester carboxylesterase